MIVIKAKISESESGISSITPEYEIPNKCKVRYINGEFQAIQQNEEWEVLETENP